MASECSFVLHPAADHAVALWQLCCRIGRTTTVACQVVDSRARYHRLQMATGAECGANAVIAQRARDGPRAYQANRHRVCIRTRSGVQRLTISIPIGAAFGHDTRTHTLRRYSYVAGPSRPHERSCSGCRAAPRSRSFGRAPPRFRLKSRCADRSFGRKSRCSTGVSAESPARRPRFPA